jgi:hypothetical protein
MDVKSILNLMLALVEVLYWISVYYARKYPDKRWPYIFIMHLGPRTDVKYMSRKDLFKSSLTFIIYAIHLTIFFYLSVYFIYLSYGDKEPPLTVMAIVCFAFPVLGGMCYLGSLYLFIRGLLRSENYVPKGCVMIHGNPWEWEHIREYVEDCRESEWEKKKWQKGPALRTKDGLSLTPYTGQQYDPKFFGLDPFGWDHDHCAICWWTICDQKEHQNCSTEGYTNGLKWICNECYDKFILHNASEGKISVEA